MTRLPTLVLACLPLAFVSISSHAAASPPADGTGGINGAAAEDAPYLILVSIDGFRWDYLEHHPTPALGELASRGVRAESLRPVYPTQTFPNHYSIATGLYPAEHGLVSNDFPSADGASWYGPGDRSAVENGRWYGGVPIWVAAERAGLVSTAYFFVGTEAPIGGTSPSHWHAFDAAVPGTERVERALSWLALPAARRPHFIALYFEHVDNASHHYGPGSPGSIAAIREVDGYLGRLLEGVEALPIREEVYVVVVSDHGQSRYRPDAEPLVLADFLDLDGVAVVEGGPFAFLHLENGEEARAASIRDAVNARWEHGRAWLREEAPDRWRLTGNPRIADVLLQADPGHAVVSSRKMEHKINTGDHGWAPEFRDMHGIFVAAGPRLPAGESVGVVDAVDVYPLLLGILGLPDPRARPHESRLPELLELSGSGARRDSAPAQRR